MAVKIQLIEATASATAINIPENVKKEVEAAYRDLVKNPGSTLHLTFDSQEERVTWTNQARVYCNTREAGALKLRQLPSKNLPDNEARFNITADLPANGERNGRK